MSFYFCETYCTLSRPLTIAEQMKAAQQQAQEQRGPDAHKKDAPDRGER